jgi:hypothetical protein
MDENTPRITQKEMIDLCKEAKINATSTSKAEREYALVVLLQKRLGRRVSTTLRHRPFEFSVATALSPDGRPAGWAG